MAAFAAVAAVSLATAAMGAYLATTDAAEQLARQNVEGFPANGINGSCSCSFPINRAESKG